MKDCQWPSDSVAENLGTFYLTVQCTKTGVEKKEECSAEQITNVKVQFRPEMESPATGRKGKRKNTLVADDLSWTYLPATEKKATEGGTTTPTGGNGGTTPTPGGNTNGEDEG